VRTVEVKLAQTQECYNQLPVIQNNITYFLIPQTYILLQTQVTCNALILAMYLLGDTLLDTNSQTCRNIITYDSEANN